MDAETRQAVEDLTNETIAIESLLFGIAMALKRRNIGIDVLREAFDHADNVAMAAVGSKVEPDAVKEAGGMVLGLLGDMRAAMLD